jgi:hypothetical protein
LVYPQWIVGFAYQRHSSLTGSDSSQQKFKTETGTSMETGTVKWFNDAKGYGFI